MGAHRAAGFVFSCSVQVCAQQTSERAAAPSGRIKDGGSLFILQGLLQRGESCMCLGIRQVPVLRRSRGASDHGA